MVEYYPLFTTALVVSTNRVNAAQRQKRKYRLALVLSLQTVHRSRRTISVINYQQQDIEHRAGRHWLLITISRTTFSAYTHFCFEAYCEIEREENTSSWTLLLEVLERTHALIKPIANLDKFGYPACDGPQLQAILDTIPGLDRDGVEYLKLTALSQLDRIRRGAREALHQLSTILGDQLRFRIITQTDILELQCKVVDRFVVARNIVLERYSHYVKSMTWIENMSTNQRRRCLSHQQNNILRMWLYQNFKNPYPDEEEKAYIVEETRLTMEQVNNWFINARSRFWKPATDFLYRESLETKMSAWNYWRSRWAL